jgi:hypothetical protein
MGRRSIPTFGSPGAAPIGRRIIAMKNRAFRIFLAVVIMSVFMVGFAASANAAKPDSSPSSSVTVFINSVDSTNLNYWFSWDKEKAFGYNTNLSKIGFGTMKDFDTYFDNNVKSFQSAVLQYPYAMDGFGGAGTFEVTITLLDKKGQPNNHPKYSAAQKTIP